MRDAFNGWVGSGFINFVLRTSHYTLYNSVLHFFIHMRLKKSKNHSDYDRENK